MILLCYQINTSTRAQWKLLLEQQSIGYIYPGDSPTNNDTIAQNPPTEEDWQIIIPITDASSKPSTSAENPGTKLIECDTNEDSSDIEPSNKEREDSEQSNSLSQALVAQTNSGIFPAARARLASLRDLGAKKIGALKLKLIENKIKSTERGILRLNICCCLICFNKLFQF